MRNLPAGVGVLLVLFMFLFILKATVLIDGQTIVAEGKLTL